MKSTKIKKIAITVIILAVVGVAAYFGVRKYQEAMYANVGSGMVEMPAQIMDIQAMVKCTGNIDAVNKKSLYTQIDGTITAVNVEKGDMVKKGDVIATLDTSDVEFNIKVKEAEAAKAALQSEYALKESQIAIEQKKKQLESGLNATIDAAQTKILSAQQSYMDAVDAYNLAKEQYDAGTTPSVAQAQQALKSAQAAYNEAHNTWDDLREEQKNHTSSYDLQKSELELQNAKQNLESAKQQAKVELDQKYEAMTVAEQALRDAERDYDASVLGVDQDMEVQQYNLEKNLALAQQDAANLELERLQASLDKYVLYAIEDGCITELKLVAGENIAKNTLAATITNFEKMQVAIKIDEYDVGEVAVGDEAAIYINSLDKTYHGKVTSISRTATVKDNVAYVEAMVEFDADEDTRSGLSAEVTVIKADRKGVVAVSAEAVNYREDHSAYVYIKDASGMPVEQDVTAGISDGAWTEIIEGVSEGDIVLEQPEVDPYAMY